MSCTIVTGFYPIKSKFSKDTYLEWGRTFLKLASPIVLFTEKNMSGIMKEMRGDRPIHIVEIPFEELEAWALYKNNWIENYNMDPEKHIHTPELYAIWAQKPFFVEKAIHLNPFYTDYFFWCDFGAFRDPSVPTTVLDSFPTTNYLPQDKIILQAIDDLKDIDKIKKEDGIYGECISSNWNEPRLVGGLWGGGIKGCLAWKQSYVEMLERYFKANRFAGKDQMVMLSAYLENPNLATVVKCTLFTIDQWFFFEYLLSNLTVTFQYNHSYSISASNNKPIVTVNMLGGLGNQLFQIATAYAYACKYNGKLQIVRNKNYNDGRPLYWDSVLRNYTPYLVDALPHGLSQWNEEGPTKYTEIPPLPQNGMRLGNYLQSSRYFYTNEIKNEIKYLFRSNHNMLSAIQERYKYILQNKDRVVVVHARRTDYLKNQDIINFHGPLTVEYYKEAIKKMASIINQPIFLLVSDDSTFWTNMLNDIPEFVTNTLYIVDNETDVNTFTLIQQFDYYIIANSTFSWWGAWLSSSPKKVIAPIRWFGPTGPKEYNDIYEDSWERL